MTGDQEEQKDQGKQGEQGNTDRIRGRGPGGRGTCPPAPTGTADGPGSPERPDSRHPAGLLLIRLTHRIRSFDIRRPWVWDTALTGFWLTAALIDISSGGWRRIPGNNDAVPLWLVVAMSAGFAAPLLIRRSRPLGALLLMLPFLLLNAWTGARLQAALLQMVVFYGIALRLPLRTLGLVLGVLSVPLAIGAVRHPVGNWDQTIVPPLYALLMVALLGIAVRSRKEYTASLVERARRLEVERDQQARLATAAERARIAREMHDIIGHNLSVITGLADGGRYAAAASPERAAQALDAIADTSRGALTELRRVLGVLREDSPDPYSGYGSGDRAPQPALTDLDRLIEGVRAAGLPVRTSVQDPGTALPAGQQLTVYRIVQEALTNTLKHTPPGTTAAVDLAHASGFLTVTVTDTGPPATTRPDSGGRGLTGMRERAALYDGTLDSGPLPAGGWCVRLRLPAPPPVPVPVRDKGSV
ncbi:sensor histidine kinase [Streptomyces tsukubensis]|uniref:sensor histidine kinase n=1 Tax=Streptomyces tsukubensis TaxID=83656 RepID=UPI003F4E8403